MNFAARLLGKSIVDKDITFLSGEGPAASALRASVAHVVRLQRLESGNEAIWVRLHHAVEFHGRHLETLMLLPRHSGYGATALLFTMIAVYVLPVAKDGLINGKEPEKVDEGDVMAIFDIR
jgi:hypothetical protein